MANYPVYQRFNFELGNEVQQQRLATVALTEKKIEDAQEKIKSLSYTLYQLEKEVDRVVTKTQNLLPETDVISLTNTLREALTIEDIDNKVRGLHAHVDDLCSVQEKALRAADSEVSIQTHSFSITNYKSLNIWENDSDFADFVQSHIDTFNDSIGSDAIQCLMVEPEANSSTVLFRFNPRFKDAVENETLNLCRDLAQKCIDYVSTHEVHSKYLNAYTTAGTTEQPFSLTGNGRMNLFSHYTDPKYLDLDLEGLKKEIAGGFGMPKDGDLLDYQVLEPHFTVPSTHPLSEDIRKWYSSSFSSKIGGNFISRDPDGFDTVARISRNAALESYPELTHRAEKAINTMLRNHALEKDATLSI